MKNILPKIASYLLILSSAFLFMQVFIVLLRIFFILGGADWNHHLLYWTIFMPIWEFFTK
ncbi:MAG: hypothetical protein KGV56_00220 [Gammaproteobacteria bacterium]|nr:hypothetical protein [Gammaproteobacteria bacterium]